MMSIVVERLTKTFSPGKGIFDLNFTVKKGEVFGFLGPNGAGKSTTIRHLLGFMKPDRGQAMIDGKSCWRDRAFLQTKIGYLPGETAFFEEMTGKKFLAFLENMRASKKTTRTKELLEYFQLDAATPIRKMSKGTKQKVALIAAFMHDPDILILDEPSSGLDPLMQQQFITFLLQEKRRGKTIFLSSHHFAEIERTCDRAGMIRDGRLIVTKEVRELQTLQKKVFLITLKNENDIVKWHRSSFIVTDRAQGQIEVEVRDNYREFFALLSTCDVNSVDVRQQSLEEVFMQFYQDERS